VRGQGVWVAVGQALRVLNVLGATATASAFGVPLSSSGSRLPGLGAGQVLVSETWQDGIGWDDVGRPAVVAVSAHASLDDQRKPLDQLAEAVAG
jgi:hypothetical protein